MGRFSLILALLVAGVAHAQPAPEPSPAPEPPPEEEPAPLTVPDAEPEPLVAEPLRVQPERDATEPDPDDPNPAPVTPTTATITDWFAGAPMTYETYPIERVRRPMILVTGMLELSGSSVIDLSSGATGGRIGMTLDARYSLAPFTEIGADVGSLDVRSFTDNFRGAAYLRRQLVPSACLRGDLLFDRQLFTVTEMLPTGPHEVSEGRRRLGVAVGTPIKLVLSRQWGVEGLERVLYYRTNPRSATLAAPLTLLWQPSTGTVLELITTPALEQLTDPTFTVQVALGFGVSFSHSFDATLRLSLPRARVGVDEREAVVNLTMRM